MSKKEEASLKRLKSLVTLVESLQDAFETMPEVVIENVLFLLTRKDILFLCDASKSIKSWCDKYLQERFWRAMFLSDTRYAWIKLFDKEQHLSERGFERELIEKSDTKRIHQQYAKYEWGFANFVAFDIFSEDLQHGILRSSSTLMQLRVFVDSKSKYGLLDTSTFTQSVFGPAWHPVWNFLLLEAQFFLGEGPQQLIEGKVPSSEVLSAINEMRKISNPALVISSRYEKKAGRTNLFVDMPMEEGYIEDFIWGYLDSLEKQYLQIAVVAKNVPTLIETEVYETETWVQRGYKEYVIVPKTEKMEYGHLLHVVMILGMQKKGMWGKWELSHSTIVEAQFSPDFFDELFARELISKEARLEEWKTL